MKIEISYDGRVGLTNNSVFLGDLSIATIVGEALKVEDTEYREINAEIEIRINLKPDAPKVWIEEDDEC